MELRKLRKLDGRGNALMSIYECDSCLWVVSVPYKMSLGDVQLKFEKHDCDHKPLVRRSLLNSHKMF